VKVTENEEALPVDFATVSQQYSDPLQ